MLRMVCNHLQEMISQTVAPLVSSVVPSVVASTLKVQTRPLNDMLRFAVESNPCAIALRIVFASPLKVRVFPSASAALNDRQTNLALPLFEPSVLRARP